MQQKSENDVDFSEYFPVGFCFEGVVYAKTQVKDEDFLGQQMICVQREKSWETFPTPIEFKTVMKDERFATRNPIEIASFYLGLYDKFYGSASTPEEQLKVEMLKNSAKLMMAIGFEHLFLDYTSTMSVLKQEDGKCSKKENVCMSVAKRFNSDLKNLPLFEVADKYSGKYNSMADNVIDWAKNEENEKCFVGRYKRGNKQDELSL